MSELAPQIPYVAQSEAVIPDWIPEEQRNEVLTHFNQAAIALLSGEMDSCTIVLEDGRELVLYEDDVNRGYEAMYELFVANRTRGTEETVD